MVSAAWCAANSDVSLVALLAARKWRRSIGSRRAAEAEQALVSLLFSEVEVF